MLNEELHSDESNAVLSKSKESKTYNIINLRELFPYLDDILQLNIHYLDDGSKVKEVLDFDHFEKHNKIKLKLV